MSNCILKAFLSQQKSSSEESEKVNEANLKTLTYVTSEAYKKLSSSQQIKDYMNIPTQNPKLDQKPISHPHFSSYDHSLEKNRWGDLDVDIEMGEI